MDTDTTPTQTHLSKSGRTPRRKFTPEFKARIVKLCEQPGAVACEVAREHRLGSYLVNRWVREHRAREAPSFVPVHVAEPVASIAEIRIECTRGQHQVCIAWPASAARECAQWLRDWLA